MSELKATSSGEIRARDALLGYWWYEKYEADKVIAELEDKCQMHDFFWEGCGFAKRGFKNTIAVSEAYDFLEEENKQLKESIAVYQRNEKLDIREIRHQKYKRCMAMAWWCRASAVLEKELDAKPYQDYYERWFFRWLKLAEQFKEAK